MSVDQDKMAKAAGSGSRRLRLRYSAACRSCAVPLPAGTRAVYFADLRQVACLGCEHGDVGESPGVESAPSAPDQTGAAAAVATPAAVTGAGEPVLAAAVPVESGVAGLSARREYARRSIKRDQAVRTAHPRLGGLILALTDEPQSTRAWARGAVGEEKLAKALEPLTARGVSLLHDRRIPGSRANIDHIAVGPAGVFVIDAKRYAGRPTLRVTGGLMRDRTETLLVSRRDCSKLVTGVIKQVEIVCAALAVVGSPEVQVSGMLAFVDADWPMFGGSFTTRGVRVLWPSKIADHLLTPAALEPARITALHTSLARAFPPA